MGSSLSVCVFYGAQLPDKGDYKSPVPHLKAGVPPSKYGADDWRDALEKHPEFGASIEFVHSGVGDDVTPHLAIKASLQRQWDDGVVALEAPPNTVPAEWHAAAVAALDCLDWTRDGEPIDRPEIKIGWFVAASYW